MFKKPLFTLAIILILAPCAAAEKSPEKSCPVYGIKSAGEYIRRAKLKCFSSTRRAKNRGYVDALRHSFSSDNKPLVFESELSGANAVPPTNSVATGLCTAVATSTRDKLNIVCEHNIKNLSKAHIHMGTAGTTGPMICMTDSLKSPLVWTCSLDPSRLDALTSGELYINLHSTDYPTGELRTQID